MTGPLLVAATKVELAAATRRLDGACRSAALGIGPERAARAMAALLAPGPVPVVVEAGLAGGLEPALRRGDVIVCRSVVRAGSSERWELDRALAGRALSALSRAGVAAREVEVVETPRIVARAGDKRALHESTRAVAVSMETAAIAGASTGTPHLAIRVIFDTVDEDLVLTDELIDGEGRVRAGALARTLARRPTTTVALVRSGIRARAALGALGRAVAAVWPALASG